MKNLLTMKLFSLLLLLFLSTTGTQPLLSQNNQTKPKTSETNPLTDVDRHALENIIIEKYYVADSSDYNHDSINGILDKGSVTYRIYVDLKPDYWLQMVYGSPKHPLTIKTSTRFYNSDLGGYIGYNVNVHKLEVGNTLLDSYITLNSASNLFAGVLLSEDPDGSVLERRKAFSSRDGLTNGNLPQLRPFNLDLSFFNNDSTARTFTTSNGGWTGFSGIKAGAKGPTKENRILIAQLTTNGTLSFDLNIQVATPSGSYLKFVAKDATEDNEVAFEGLSFKP
jgi:hypothetical protein